MKEVKKLKQEKEKVFANKKKVNNNVNKNINKNVTKRVNVNTKKVNKNVVSKKDGLKEEFKFKDSKLKIIPLGGIEEIGKNITVFEFENEMIVVDCGVAFPGDDMLGID